MIWKHVTDKGRACIPEGLTKALMVINLHDWKVEERRKIPWLDLGSLERAAIQFTLKCL